MRRIDLSQKKHRRASRTLLIFGEGLGEEMFLRHLRRLYSHNTGVAITIRKGRGSNTPGIVVDACRVPGAFDRRIVVLDNDKPEPEMRKAREEAGKRGIELVENTPCLEFLLLSIVGAKPAGQNSIWCKKEFESKHISQGKRSEPNEYLRVFPRELLEKQRAEISELDKLVQIMEGR